jgi:RecB family endonuclease NucS
VEQWDSLPWAAELEYLGRQVAADEGFIDIFARDRSTGDFVVIELKKDQTDDEVVGQLSRYMGWAKERRAAPAGVKVRGIIVAHEATPKLRAAASAHDNVSLYLYKLALALQSVSLLGR